MPSRMALPELYLNDLPSMDVFQAFLFRLSSPRTFKILYITPSITMAANPAQNGLFVHNNTVAPEHPNLMSMFSLKSKTAIVTGSGAGIGLAVAHGLAEAGANVAMWYNSNTKCPERAAEVAQKFGVQSA